MHAASWKLILLLLLVMLVGIFVLENLAVVEYAFLGWKVALPRYQMAIGLVAAGFVMGLLVVSMKRRRRKADKKKSIPSQEGTAEESDRIML